MQSNAVTNEFTMDQNLLFSVIKSQAGSLTKALVEGVMNSIDAGATRVEVEVQADKFVISDDGKGFSSEDEIRLWFGRFGTPHQEGDAQFARFRMGRGQLMAFARTLWESNRFVMDVDVEGRGLTYDLLHRETSFPGCRVTGTLYERLTEAGLRDELTELRMSVRYAPAPVYVNGELFGSPAARTKGWTFQDDDAYYRVIPDSDDLLLYNQGVYVQTRGAWSTGMGGTVVSKKAVEVNFARNAVLDRCPTWARIRTRMQEVVMGKLSSADKLTDDERRFLARRINADVPQAVRDQLRKAKLLTDPTGRHHSLESLSRFKRFVYSPNADTMACATQGKDGTFVVTEDLLNRFGVYSIESLIHDLSKVPGIIAEGVEVLDIEALPSAIRGTTEESAPSELSRKQRAAFEALTWLNDEVVKAFSSTKYASQRRELRLGKHKQNTFVAWTDGRSYITANKHFLKYFERGLSGVSQWVLTLVHEYAHSNDDSESHAHGLEFFAKYHDMSFCDTLSLPSLAQQGLVRYMSALRKEGLSCPRAFRRELRPNLSCEDGLVDALSDAPSF